MNMFVIALCCFFIVSINGEFTIVRQSPKTNMLSTSNQFIFEINQTVNRPSFQSFIHIFNATTNTSIYQIDVRNSSTNSSYYNNTIEFYLPASITFNISDTFYITFDEGVLFSNSTLNSTAQNGSNFWYLTVVALQTSTSISTVSDHTSMQTTNYAINYTSMPHNDTTAFVVTTAMNTYTSINQTISNLNTTTPGNFILGEPPPSRSAQLGMGLGITFITVMIIGEIIYFKYCCSGNGRSGSYFT